MTFSLNNKANTVAILPNRGLSNRPDWHLGLLDIVIAAQPHRYCHPALNWFIGRSSAVRIADSVDELVSRLTTSRSVDLVVIDCSLLMFDCGVGMRAVRQQSPRLPVIALCTETCCSRGQAITLLREGATALLPASMPEECYEAAVTLALQGQQYAPPHFLVDFESGREFVSTTRADAPFTDLPYSTAKPDPREVLSRLSFSPRECDVAVFLAQGHSNKEIAHRLSIQEVTVKVYASSIYRKLGVRNRTQAAARLLSKGID